MNTYLDGRRRAGPTAVTVPRVRLLVVVIGVGALTARLFYLQIANGTEYAALSTANRDRPGDRSPRHAA